MNDAAVAGWWNRRMHLDLYTNTSPAVWLLQLTCVLVYRELHGRWAQVRLCGVEDGWMMLPLGRGYRCNAARLFPATNPQPQPHPDLSAVVKKACYCSCKNGRAEEHAPRTHGKVFTCPFDGNSYFQSYYILSISYNRSVTSHQILG